MSKIDRAVAALREAADALGELSKNLAPPPHLTILAPPPITAARLRAEATRLEEIRLGALDDPDLSVRPPSPPSRGGTTELVFEGTTDDGERFKTTIQLSRTAP